MALSRGASRPYRRRRLLKTRRLQQRIVASGAGRKKLALSSSGLVRRKLFDLVLGGFLVGNTLARSLLSKKDVQAFIERWTNEDDVSCKTLRFLYIGVGDVRNPLYTLYESVPEEVNVQLHLNDSSSVVLARDIVILMLASGSEDTSIEQAIQVWSDASLYRETYDSLQSALRTLVHNIEQIEWLRIAPEDLCQLQQHWLAWSKIDAQDPYYVKLRQRAIDQPGVGHGRAGASASWLASGVSACPNRADLLFVNATLFDMSQKLPRFLELQGPAGAFSSLAGLESGSDAFAVALRGCWHCLFSSFYRRIRSGKLSVHVWGGDGIALLSRRLRSPDIGNPICSFHAIDTSNVMDYVGLWNLLLVASPCLQIGCPSFVLTEQIMGVASDTESMLEEIIPHDATLSHELAGLLGLRAMPLPKSLLTVEFEKVVRVRWQQCSASVAKQHADEVSAKEKSALLLEIRQLLESVANFDFGRLESLWLSELRMVSSCCHEAMAEMKSMGRKVHLRKLMKERVDEILEFISSSGGNGCDLSEEVAQLHSQLFRVLQCIFVPQPLTSEMLSHIHRPVELSFAWPLHTVATFAEIVAVICERHGRATDAPVANLLDGFFKRPELYNHDHVRNRLLAMRIECAFHGKRLIPALGDSASASIPMLSSLHLCVFVIEPTEDIRRPHSGIFEPALSAFLLSDAAALAALQRNSGLFKRGRNGDEYNVNFHWVGKQSARTLQIVDNLVIQQLEKVSQDAFAKEKLSLVLPKELDFDYLVLVDIQRYAVISQPVLLRDHSSVSSRC